MGGGIFLPKLGDMKTNRRRFLRSSLVAAAATGLIGIPQISIARERPKITYPALTSGVSVIINGYMQAKRFDLKHGIDLSLITSYTSVTGYYNDFAAGTFDVAVGSWDTFVELYHRGVPINMICTLTPANLINIVAGPNGPKNAADLRGKNIAAVAGSGSLTMASALIADLYKIDLAKDATLQNVPSPVQSLTLLQAGNVDAAISWEPSVSAALAQSPNLKPIFNVGEAYLRKTGTTLPYFAISARRDVQKRVPDLGPRLAGSFVDCIAAIKRNPDEAFALAAPKLNVTPQVLRMAYDDHRLTFESVPMTGAAGRKIVVTAYAYMRGHGVFEDKPLNADFFV
jgi:NitT/TauT family transport system substrate-binding protein